MPEIFDRAEDAWNYLVSHGGLEVNGRDALLVEQLTERLTVGTLSDPPDDAPEPELGDVLKKASVEQLVNAMFGVVRPYIGMMRDLLNYFTKAGVTEGPGQWKLALTSKTDSLEIDLDSFKKFIRVLETRHVPLEVPVLNPDQLWSISSDAFSDEMESRRPIGMRPSSTDTDSGTWLSTSETTSWLPSPPVVYRMLARNDCLRDVAAVLYEVTSAVQSSVPNYKVLRTNFFTLRTNTSEPIREYLRIEYDRWIETMVSNLAAFEIAPDFEQSKIALKAIEVLKGV